MTSFIQTRPFMRKFACGHDHVCYAYTCPSNSKSVQTYVFLVREHVHEHVW